MCLNTQVTCYIRNRILLTFVLIFCLSFAASAAPENSNTATTNISADVADAILKELKEIRRVLEKIEQKGVAAKSNKPRTAKVSTKGKPSLGASDAPLTVVEFTDYQCPYCLRFSKTTFPPLKKKYIDTGKVRWVALNLPLSFHKDARKAAQGAHCAGEQDKFWEMRQVLFEHPKKLSEKDLSQHAKSLALDVDAFDACLSSDRHLAAIDKDASDAAAVRLTGTPSFIIGKTTKDQIEGKVVIGAQPLKVFDATITKLLENNQAKK